MTMRSAQAQPLVTRLLLPMHARRCHLVTCLLLHRLLGWFVRTLLGVGQMVQRVSLTDSLGPSAWMPRPLHSTERMRMRLYSLRDVLPSLQAIRLRT